MDQAIQDFVGGKRIAVAGVSRSGGKFGNMAVTELKKRGYQVFVVHPEVRQINGEACFPDLHTLQGNLDGVLISLSGKQAAAVMQDTAEIGVRNVWLQQNAQTPELLALADSLGLNLVHGKCILMYAPPVRSYHRWHRFFARLMGQL